MSMTRHDYRIVCDSFAKGVVDSGIDDTIAIAKLLATVMYGLSQNQNFNQEYFAKFFWDRLIAHESLTRV